MKARFLAVAVAAGWSLSGCVGLPSSTAPKIVVSHDYEATGDAAGIRAFVYGQKTVIEFDSMPVWVSVQDANGVTVPGERLGRHYRLSRKLNDFSLWTTTRAVLFSTIPHQPPGESQANGPAPRVAAAAVAAAETVSQGVAPSPSLLLAPVKLEEVSAPEQYPEQEALELASKQLQEIRSAIAKAPLTVDELRALSQRTDEVEARLVTSAAVLFRVQFDTGKTDFKPSDALAKVLIPAAKAAQSINIRGRTDSKIAGPDDPSIALARAQSAQRYLVDQGVDANKIRLSSLAQGDFIAPATVAGRALNRRVEVELTNPRYATARTQSVAIAKVTK
jgi:outer membrane protein OmpA-like peptidoglycan-associated protein